MSAEGASWDFLAFSLMSLGFSSISSDSDLSSSLNSSLSCGISLRVRFSIKNYSLNKGSIIVTSLASISSLRYISL